MLWILLWGGLHLHHIELLRLNHRRRLSTLTVSTPLIHHVPRRCIVLVSGGWRIGIPALILSLRSDIWSSPITSSVFFTGWKVSDHSVLTHSGGYCSIQFQASTIVAQEHGNLQGSRAKLKYSWEHQCSTDLSQKASLPFRNEWWFLNPVGEDREVRLRTALYRKVVEMGCRRPSYGS